MMKFSRALLAVMLTIAGLSIAASSASAISGVSISPGGAITATSLARLVSQGTLGTLECNVTLRGTLTAGLIPIGATLARIGSLTSGTATNCTLNGNPTTVTLNFGTWNLAANANGLIVVLGASFSASVCTYTGNVTATPQLPSPVSLLITQASTLNAGGICGSTTILAGQGFLLSPAQNIVLLP